MPRTPESILSTVLDELLGVAQEFRPVPEDQIDSVEPTPDNPNPRGRGIVFGPSPNKGPGLTPEQVTKELKRIQDKFGVGTAGQFRSEADDAKRRAKTGRKSVSDHVGGFALDLTGDPAKLDKVAEWARQQPHVKYVLWRTKDHFDHVHISFNRAA